MSDASNPELTSADTSHKGKQKLNLVCPSAQPGWSGANVFGVVLGTALKPAVSYLSETLPISESIVDLVKPVTVGEVVRIAAPCATHRCQHFESGGCNLGRRTIEYLEPVVDKLPRCAIRPSCRWWNEQGKEACYRCPQVVTNSFSEDEKIVKAATPPLKT
jgi:hypothetical protein